MEINETADNLFFTINEVAQQIGVVPATIRNWEKAGLFTARRRPNGYRIYDLNDIDVLKRIRSMSKIDNMGFSGIRMIMTSSTQSGPVALAEQAHPKEYSVSKRVLGRKWKESRQKRNYSLEEVANIIGISASYLYKIENEQANASFEILQKLANFYGESLLDFVERSTTDNPVVRKGEGEALEIELPGLKTSSLISKSKHTLSSFLCEVEPHCEHNMDSIHSGEEFVYVLSGKVEFTLNEKESYMLSSGDSICFSSSKPHRWRNISNRTATLLWICTPIEIP